MPGRKKPKMTENERDHEYVMAQKRSHGDEIVGDEAKDLDEKGAAGQVAREREKYAEDRERLRRQDF